MSTEKQPLVGIIMGSDSDLDIMGKAAETLDTFGVSNEVRIISAHRTPKKWRSMPPTPPDAA